MLKVFIQNEAGTNTANRYNEQTLEYIESMKLCRKLPFHYGFIPGTIGDDGDCIDFWLVSSRPYKTGQIVNSEPLRLMEFYENNEEDFKVIGCPSDESVEFTDRIYQQIKEYTLEIFAQFPEHKIKIGSLLSAEEAVNFILRHSPR